MSGSMGSERGSVELPAGWISVGTYCECDHPRSDHETAGAECAYGWTNEPGERPCDCLEFALRGYDVIRSTADLCPACGGSGHEWWPVGDDSYGCYVTPNCTGSGEVMG